MAIFDIPLRVKLSIKLRQRRDKPDYTITDNGDGTYQAEAKVMLSMRAHKWVLDRIGFNYGPSNSFDLSPDQTHDCYSTISKSAMADLHGFLANTNHVYCGEEGNLTA